MFQLFCPWLGLLGQGQKQSDAGAQSLYPLSDRNASAVRTDHALTDRQPQSGTLATAITSGGGVEHVENLCPFNLRDSRALITDGKPQLTFIRPCLQYQPTLWR